MLDGLRACCRCDFKFEILIDLPLEGAGKVDRQGDELRASAFPGSGRRRQRLEFLSRSVLYGFSGCFLGRKSTLS